MYPRDKNSITHLTISYIHKQTKSTIVESYGKGIRERLAGGKEGKVKPVERERVFYCDWNSSNLVFLEVPVCNYL